MIKWISFLLLASFLTVLHGCTEKTDRDNIEKKSNQVEAVSERRYFKEYAGPQENLTLIRDKLYQDENGELYFNAPYHVEERSIYLKYEGVPDSIHRPPTHLTNVIDRQSWHHVFDSFYADKDNLYCHYSMSDGGNIARVRGVDPQTFNIIIADYETNSWHKLAIDGFDRASLKDSERAWHITDGESVIGIRCDNQGPLTAWSPEVDLKD